MSLSINSVKKLLNQYKTWVRENPNKASDYENAFRWATYFFGGRINDSVIFHEAIYAAPNLLTFLNDRIIQSSTEDTGPAGKIKVWLTVLGYLEVIIELSANQLWGPRMKWVVIGAIQVLKCALKLTLLFKHKERVIASPAIQPLERGYSEQTNGEALPVGSVAFTLKRSGRVIRKVEASTSNSARLWKPPVIAEDDSDDSDNESQRRNLLKEITGETLYIVKPLAQLASTYRYGETSWKPWMISLAMDVASFTLHSSTKKRHVSKDERLEMSRRSLYLVFYLLRSPFYERHSADRMAAFIDSATRTIPLSNYLLGPLKERIPFYHSTYSYIWSS